jgi:DNA-binding response OmpR family regulator
VASVAKLLLVEDDLTLAAVMSAYFETAGFAVRKVIGGREMMAALAAEPADLILLDLELPDEDGFVLARRLRQSSDVPIVIVTGRSDAANRVAGLELGADDYVTKPFEPRELVARVRNILHRAGRRPASAEVVQADGLGIRLDDRTVIDRQGASVHLTPSEHAILAALIHARGRALSREQLLDAGNNFDGPESERSVDVTISRLRRKLERNPQAPALIVTVQGLGYRFNPG